MQEAGGLNINEHTADHTKHKHSLKLRHRHRPHRHQCFLKWKASTTRNALTGLSQCLMMFKMTFCTFQWCEADLGILRLGRPAPTAPCPPQTPALFSVCHPRPWFPSLRSRGLWHSGSVSSHSCHFSFSVLEFCARASRRAVPRAEGYTFPELVLLEFCSSLWNGRR